MAAGLTEIREALRLALVAALGEEEQNIYGYVLKEPSLPVVWVRPKPDAPVIYHQAMQDGYETWEFLVEAICGSLVDVGAQKMVDAYVDRGAKSIKAAIEADDTLGGVVQRVVVVQCNNYVEFVRADGSVAIGANWQVQVYP